MKATLFVVAGALGAVAVAWALFPVGRDWFIRSFRSPRRLRWITATLGGILLLSLIACLVSPEQLGWCAVPMLLCGAGLVVGFLVAPTMRIEHAMAVQPRRVLAIGAHPDDLELACGATLAKLADAGHEIRAIVMSNGSKGGDSLVRVAEASSGSEFMGVAEVQVHDFHDTNLSDHGQEMVQAIEAYIKDFQPDVVMTHSGHDYHQDHQAVHSATMRAARHHSSILCFESPSATRQFNPSVFVDIDGYVDVKIHAVAMHRDQKGKPYMSAERVRSLAAFRGAQVKKSYAEGFEPVRLLGSAVGEF
ncbi:PIG-L deacetylase family protein [Paenarthrobacter sp. S56]|uniref:PIG-L deacetylase family protein n=1 Tax=Paenarthrobacter sp. S56 TaxID=3138179 RepID=UPI00321C0208